MGGQFWMPITPDRGSIFHADQQTTSGNLAAAVEMPGPGFLRVDDTLLRSMSPSSIDPKSNCEMLQGCSFWVCSEAQSGNMTWATGLRILQLRIVPGSQVPAGSSRYGRLRYPYSTLPTGSPDCRGQNSVRTAADRCHARTPWPRWSSRRARMCRANVFDTGFPWATGFR